MYLFPAIDLRNGQVVRLQQGDFDRQTTYAHDPVEQAAAFAEAGVTWLHLVDLDGAKSGQMNHVSIIEKICALGQLKVEVGGGVRNEAVIDRLLSVGVDRVILGTAALTQWDWFESLMGHDKYRDHLVLGLDARNQQVAIGGWQNELDVSTVQIAQRVSDWPLAAIEYTDITADGMLRGPNLEPTRQLAESTNVPVIASGGVGSLDDLSALRELPIEGAIIGRAIYDGTFTISEAIAVFE